ncbi:MAG: hypothetical protein JST52_11985 [Bacteroidetes bacterium]|nr:hypothetical protein [Bacteroidota bacterium]
MAEILIVPSDVQADQWVAYAGLDPHASGTSINLSRLNNHLIYIKLGCCVNWQPNNINKIEPNV